jgi:hypothetical protein
MTYRLGRRDLLTLLSLGGPAMLASQASALDQTGVGKVGGGKQPALAHGLCLNEDNSHFFFNQEGHGFDVKAVDAWVDQYAHTQVRELMLCPNCMRTSYGSKVWTPIWKGLDPQAGPDQPLFASLPPEQRPGGWQWAHNAWKLDHDGIDVYKRWIERSRKWGISPWISMRMNDVHCVDDEHHYIHGDFWRQNPQFRRVNYRFSAWTDRAFDYGHPEVRKYHMALVRELAERYDFDGLELDWMRFGFHFRPGHEAEGVGLLTEFTAEVRDLLNGWQKKRGHRIRLGARVPSRPQSAVGLGMDAATWAQRGLVDMIVITPFWATIETDMPVELWKTLLRGTNVTLAAGLEVLARPYHDFKPQNNSLETVRGAAATLLDRGADRIYLFNYMGYAGIMSDFEDYPALLREAGNLDTLSGKPRRHMITYADTWAPGEPRPQQLPAPCVPKGWNAFRVPTGPRPASGRAVVRLGIQGAAEAEVKGWEVRVNGELCSFAGMVKPDHCRPDDPMFEFLAPPSAMNRGYNLIEILPQAEAKIVWVEMAIGFGATPA